MASYPARHRVPKLRRRLKPLGLSIVLRREKGAQPIPFLNLAGRLEACASARRLPEVAA